VIAIAFGLAFVVAPARMLTEYGVAARVSTVIMSRFFGAALLNLGLVLFLARRVTDGVARMAIVRGSLVGAIVGLVIAIRGQQIGVFNSLGWSSVAIYGLLTLGYAYFSLGNSGKTTSTL
jgi:hypothetical protein